MILMSCNEKENLKPAPIVDFELSSDTLYIYDTLHCINNSKNAQSYVWDFDERDYLITFSNEENPEHIYFYSGTYEIRLTAMDGQMKVTGSKKIVVLKESLKGWWFGYGISGRDNPKQIYLDTFFEIEEDGRLTESTTCKLIFMGTSFEYDVEGNYDKSTGEIAFSCWRFNFTGTYDGQNIIEGTLSLTDRDYPGEYEMTFFWQN